MRINHIDALRGLAAFLVVVLHLSYSSNIVNTHEPSFLFYLLKVEAFYVITGFALIYGLYHYNYRLSLFPGFMAKRLLRLEPAYLTALAIAFGVAAVTGAALPSLRGALFHIGYLNDFFGEKWFVPPYWTLAIEFQFYLFVGLAYKAFAVKRNLRFAIFAAALLAAMFLAHRFLPPLNILPKAFGFFLLGVAVFRLKVLKMPVWLYLAVSAAALGVIAYLYDWRYAFTAFATVLGVHFFTVPNKGFFGTRLHWLGKVSYSLYLIHWPVGMTMVVAAKRVPFLAAHASVPVTAAVMASLGSAWLLHRYVERPSVRWSRRLMSAPKPLQPLPVVIPEEQPLGVRIANPSEKVSGNVRRLMRRGRDKQTV